MRWLFLVQVIFLQGIVNAEDCPLPCICYENADEERTLTVDCRNQGLLEIPLGVPPTTSHLDVSYNSIQFVRSVDLQNLPVLVYLQLHTNDIIDIESGAFQDLPALEALTLQNNLLRMLRPGIFNGLSNLHSLNLFNNYLEELNPNVFNPLVNLVYLDVAYNSLEVIMTGTFSSNLSRLVDINLSENFIGNIEREAFSDLPFLRILNIEGNQLQYVTTDAWVDVPFLHSVDIDRNPLECGCMALWLRQWFIDRSLRGPILCMMPFDLQGMDLLQLIPDDFCRLPTASIMEMSPVVLAEGMTLQLTCVTSGAPPPTSMWSRDGETFDLMDSRLIIEEDSLVINNVVIDDSGQYFCSVTSSAGTTASSIDVIVVATVDLVTPLTIATIGDRVVLECANDLPISVETKWMFLAQSANISTLINFTDRFVMGERGELVIFEVQEEDMGRYECVLAQNVSLFQDLQLQAVPMISINPEPSCNTPNSIFLQNIDSIALECVASGIPTPFVTWITPQNENISGEGIAVVPLFTPLPENAGEYICTAVNDVGIDVRVIQVNIMIVLSSDIPVFSSEQFLVGQTAILSCSFPNRTTLDFRWIRIDRLPLSPLSVQTTDGTLIIPELTLDDITVYRCQALLDNNEIGLLEQGVLVFEPATIIGGYPLPEFRVVMENDDVILNCSIRGNVRPTVEWLFENETIVEGDRFQFNSDEISLGSLVEELIITDVQSSDSGLYICNVSNIAAMQEFSDFYSYFLDVQEAIMRPFFRQQPLPVTNAIVGDTARLHCQAENALSLSWFMTPIDDDSPITEIFASERIVISPMELVIFNVEPEDEGFYFCMAQNEIGQIFSTFGQFNVWIPPRIQEALPINYLIVEGTSSIVIPCYGTGDPVPVTDWLRDNQVLPFSTKQRILPDGSLEIFQISPDDAGEYVCRLANAAGQQFRTVNVIVRAIPRAQIDPSDPSPLDIGSQLSLFCTDMGTRPEELETLMWLRDDNPLITSGNVVVFPEIGELILSDLQISDSGNYTCEISSYAGASSTTVEVIVEDPFLGSGAMIIPLSITSPTTRHQILSEGQTAQFVCITTRPPPPNEIAWFKDGSLLRNLKRITIDQETGGLVTIIDTRITDEGEYMCIATNRIGERESINFTLTISTRPIFTWPPEGQQVAVGQNIRLRCKATGRPEPQIIWLHNGTELVPDDCIIINATTNELTICNTTSSSSGWYSCFVQNMAGSAEYTVAVVVTPEPPIPPNINITSQLESDIITFGSSLILDCIVTGTPQPVVTWMKDGMVLNTTCTGPDQVFGGECLIVDDISVYIQNTRVTDSGTYTCVAENIAGTAEKSVSILVEAPSILPSFTVFPRIINISSELVAVECQADGQPPPVLSWLTGDYENISTNNTDRIYTENGVLYITSPTADDSGQYICRVENRAGINQASITLWLAEETDNITLRTEASSDDLQAPKFLVFPEDVETYEGVSIIVPCKTNDTKSFTVWRKNNDTLYQTDAVTVTTDGSLVIERSKVNDSGTFDCVAINEGGVAIATISIQVYGRPTPPEYMTTPTDLRVTSGSDFMLPCQPDRSTNEKVNLQWLLNGEPLINICGEVEVREDGSLVITNATATAAGIYICRLSNQYTTVDAMATVIITDYSINTTLTVNADEAYFQLECPLVLSDTSTESDIQWSMGLSPLYQSPFIVPFGSVLLFLTVLYSHQGEYTCTYNHMTYSTFLEVLVSPTIVNHTSLLTVTSKSSVILQCTAIGNPRPQINWFQDGIVIVRGILATPLGDGSLYLHPPFTPGQHNYTCVATNQAGSTCAETIITVQ